MWEASKRYYEGKQCCCCPHFLRPSSGGRRPPPKKAECLLGLPSFSEGERAQHEKRGEDGHPPPPTHNFVTCTPLLTSQTTKEVRYQAIQAHRDSTPVDSVKYSEYEICNNAICRGRVLPDWLGLNQFID